MRPRTVFAALIMLALITAPASAAEFWVDAVAGVDTNPGTELLPFATITHAVANGGTGATIHVMPGVYDEALGEVFPITLLQNQTLTGKTTVRLKVSK